MPTRQPHRPSIQGNSSPFFLHCPFQGEIDIRRGDKKAILRFLHVSYGAGYEGCRWANYGDYFSADGLASF